MAIVALANSPRDFLEATAKVLGLAAALLPISGVALRWIAFQFGTPLNISANQLAWSAPVDQLAATGFFGLFPWAILFVGLPLVVIWANRQPFFRSRQHHTAVEIFTNPGIVSSWVALVIFLAIFGEFPSAGLAMASSLVLGNFSSWLGDQLEPLKLRHLWPFVAITLLSGSLISGLDGRLNAIQPGDYTFTKTVADVVGNGRFVRLGESGDLVYLLSCRSTGDVIAVAKSSVESVRFDVKPMPHISQPSLLVSWRQHRGLTLGFQPRC